MRVVRLTVVPGADGMLRFAIPAGDAAPGGVEVAVVMAAANTSGVPPAKTPEELGWPPGYFENVVGSIEDDTFCRPPQLEFGPPVSLDGNHRPPTPEELGWPPGYFEQTAGSIPDPTFERGHQGEYETRESLG